MLSLSSISIRRPVLATVMSLAILLFGILGYNYLGVREYPNTEPPIITVSTDYTGADGQVIETQITEPLEETINGISGIRKLSSVSRDGRSTITVEFNLARDLEAAANDVRSKVAQARGRLPDDAEPPVVEKSDATSDPIVFLNIKSEERSLLELTELADNVFKERFQTIQDVSQVQIWGDKTYSMRLWLDPGKMKAYGVTPIDVRNALKQENVELPSGAVEGETVELSIRTKGRLSTVKEFNNMIIREADDQVIRFRDIGEAKLGPVDKRTILKRDGIPMVGTVIRPQPGANYIDIVDKFYERLEKIKRDLPPDIELNIGFDTTRYIRSSINQVQETILVAFILVITIIFIFLRDWRTTLIPVIVVPIAIIGSFFIMYVSGFTINVLTLLALVLAIGLVVDDAIVVLENIYSKIEEGYSPKDAALIGANEIFFAVISTTLALAAVFLPIIFLQGITGRLFQEFALVIAGCVLISSFVALSLSPMLSSKILKKRETHSWFYNKTEAFFVSLTNGYRRTLEAFMQFRWVAFIIILGLIGGIYGLYKAIPSELAPIEDRNNLRMFATGPQGATFTYMDRYMDSLIKEVKTHAPERKAIISVTSPGFGANTSKNSGFMRLMLSDKSKRDVSQQEIADRLNRVVSEIPGARTFVTQEQTIGGGFGSQPVEFVIQAPNMERLKAVLPAFMDKVQQHSTFGFTDVNLKFNKPELEMTFDRDKTRKLGVNARNIAQTLQLAFSSQRMGYFIMDGKQYQIIGQVKDTKRDEPSDLRNLYVRNKDGEQIPIANLITVEETSGPPTIYRYNRYVSATVSASLTGDKTIGQGISEMRNIADTVLDNSFSTALSGTSKDYAESATSLIFAFVLALVIIFLVLSAQFESFRDPLIIMLTVPLAVSGALLVLWYYNETLNIFSQIGIIMLIGLVTKNAILIVEFSNQQKAKGYDIMESVMIGASRRFRPILMTSISTILGITPLVIGGGAGSESRASMGIAVIGGMIFATLLSLYVIPAVYTFISEKSKSVSNVEEVADNSETSDGIENET